MKFLDKAPKNSNLSVGHRTFKVKSTKLNSYRLFIEKIDNYKYT